MQSSRNSIQFVVPDSPRGKQRPRMTKAGHAYTPKETVIYENLVKLACREAMGGREPLHGAIEMTIVAYFDIPKSTSKKKRERMISGEIYHTKKPDADNIIKSIADGCNKVAYDDDKQICVICIVKKYSVKPRVEVLIKEIGELP